MEMTNEEILRNYRQAKDPHEQVKILADLNVCSRTRIVQILIEQGVDPKALPKIRGNDRPLQLPVRQKKIETSTKALEPETRKRTAPKADTLERDIEGKLRKRVKAYGGRCLKWVSPGESGVPDRIVLLPGGRIIFVETKRPQGGKLSKLQNYWGRTLTDMGFEAWQVWNLEDLANFENKVLNKGVTR